MTLLAEFFPLIMWRCMILAKPFPLIYVTLYDIIGRVFSIDIRDAVWRHWLSFSHWFMWRCIASLTELFPFIHVTLYDITGRAFPVYLYVTLCDISGRAFCIYLCDVVSHQWQSLFACWFMWCCTTSCLSSNILCITMWKKCLKRNASGVSLSGAPAWVPICCALPCGTNVLNIMLLFAKSPFQILLLEFQYVVHDRVEQLS